MSERPNVAMMRWFDRDWVTGGLSDTEWTRRIEGYRVHLASIAERLDAGSVELAGDSFTLHDGQVDRWEFSPTGFTLRVLTGDLQRGYEWSTLRYEGAELLGAGVDDLARWLDGDELTEVGEVEIDCLPDGRLVHRILLWPDGEFGIAFRRLEIERLVASSNDRR